MIAEDGHKYTYQSMKTLIKGERLNDQRSLQRLYLAMSRKEGHYNASK
jgi:hypothetical protein